MKNKYDLDKRYKKLFWEDRIEYLEILNIFAKPIHSAMNRIKTFFYVLCFFLTMSLLTIKQAVETSPELVNQAISQTIQSPSYFLFSIVIMVVLGMGVIFDSIDIYKTKKNSDKFLDQFLKERGL